MVGAVGAVGAVAPDINKVIQGRKMIAVSLCHEKKSCVPARHKTEIFFYILFLNKLYSSWVIQYGYKPVSVDTQQYVSGLYSYNMYLLVVFQE